MTADSSHAARPLHKKPPIPRQQRARANTLPPAMDRTHFGLQNVEAEEPEIACQLPEMAVCDKS